MTDNVVNLGEYRKAKQQIKASANLPFGPAFAMWATLFGAYTILTWLEKQSDALTH